MKEIGNTNGRSMSRRGFVRATAFSCAGIALFGLAGCSNGDNGSSPSASNGSEDVKKTQEIEETQTTPSGDQLILVFSRAGENYGVGNVEVGNTMVVAQMIQEKTGAELIEIEPVDPYPVSYDETTELAKTEQEENARPAIAALPDLSNYKTVFLGFPIWWGDAPMPFYTAVEGIDWSGKTVAPFCTHAGSQDAGLFQKLKSICKGADILSGLSIQGTTAQNDRSETEADVDEWLSSLQIS